MTGSRCQYPVNVHPRGLRRKMCSSLEYWAVATPSWGPSALYVTHIDCLGRLKIDYKNGSRATLLRWLVKLRVRSRRCKNIVVETDERFVTRNLLMVETLSKSEFKQNRNRQCSER